MACETCHDSQWVIERVDGVDRVRRCDCWRAAVAEQQLAQARIPRRYLHCELANFEQNYDSLREAHRRSRSSSTSFPVVEQGAAPARRHGVGKTHLAVAILKELHPDEGRARLFLRDA